MLPHHVRSYSSIRCRPTRHKSTLTSWDWVELSQVESGISHGDQSRLVMFTHGHCFCNPPSGNGLPACQKASKVWCHSQKKLMHCMRHIVLVQWRLSNCCGALATWCTCFIDLFGSLYVVCTMKNLIFFLLSALFNICQIDNSKRVECFVRVNHYWVYENFTLYHLRYGQTE